MLVKGILGTSLPDLFVNMIIQSRWNADWNILHDNSICSALKWNCIWEILTILYMLTKDVRVFLSDDWVGVGDFSKVVATFNHMGGSFNLLMATTGDVWIIPTFFF